MKRLLFAAALLAVCGCDSNPLVQVPDTAYDVKQLGSSRWWTWKLDIENKQHTFLSRNTVAFPTILLRTEPVLAESPRASVRPAREAVGR